MRNLLVVSGFDRNQLEESFINRDGDGTYTAEGITKLCEGLKGSAVTSLKCAAAPRVFAFVSAPADTHHSCPPMQLVQERDP